MSISDRTRFAFFLNLNGDAVTYNTVLHGGQSFKAEASKITEPNAFIRCRDIKMTITTETRGENSVQKIDVEVCRRTEDSTWEVMEEGWRPSYQQT